MSAKTTGRLYGEEIEAQKWIVDGRDYKPLSTWEQIKRCLSVAATRADRAYKYTVIAFNTVIGVVTIHRWFQEGKVVEVQNQLPRIPLENV